MNSAWHGNEDIMAEKVDYGTLKKGGFMRQKQKNNFSLRYDQQKYFLIRHYEPFL